MLGQVNDKVITPRAQPAQQGSLFGELAPGTKGAPVAPDGMELRERWMTSEHRRGIVVDERVDLEAWRVRLQHAQHRRREEHVAVMPQLDDERPSALAERDGVLHHPASVP